MKKIVLFLISVILTKYTIAQNCSCADNYAWLKETFEKNDAGFQYSLEQKGEAEYKKLCDIYSEKVKTITDKTICAETLSGWLSFFRKGHVWLEAINTSTTPTAGNPDNEKIKAQFKNWETLPYNEKEFKTYLSKIKEPGLEGIWSSSPYTIGVRKVKNEYIGFVIEADGVYWSKSQVKFKIKDENGKLSGTYYMRDHAPNEIKEVKFLGKNYLSLGSVLFKRISPEFPPDQALDRYYKFISSPVPLFERISDKTVILRIPSFDGSAKKMIDSLILSNMKTLTSTENLIIDLRNNGGGSDGSFAKIIPLIYTNPITTVGVEFLSTPLNNKRMEEFTKDPDFTEDDKKWAKESLDKLNNNIGKFVSLDSSSISVDTYDTIYTYPKNVGIIVNNGNGSTTEQFLLAAKQSKKVKLFGTSTYGSLDISNMYSVKSPCNDLELGYCLSKSKRIPEFTIDGKGLQPDFYIDRTIPQHEWIDFVNEMLSGKK